MQRIIKVAYLVGCFVLTMATTFSLVSGQGVIDLPQTGQTICYDTDENVIECVGTGQDGEWKAGVEWPDPRFTVSGDCVTDNLTGLMWAKNANLPDGTRTWQGALDFVASINAGAGLCGYHDWRLPNINELESLVNAGEGLPETWLNNKEFINVQSDIYWSSTTSAHSTVDAWLVFMWDGYVGYGTKSNHDGYVWPVCSGQLNNSDAQYPANVWKTGQTTSYVGGDDGDLERGVAWPALRFSDHGDGTVTDNLTGLMWAKNANLPDGTRTWQGALDYINDMNKVTGLGGYHDWRLPNRKELFSLIDHSRYSPPLPADHLFQNVQSRYYWSSTTYAYITDYAWVVNMWSGYVYGSYEYYYGSYLYVWPVRSGQGSFDHPDISVTPNPVPFGNVNVGGTSDQTTTIKNDGNGNLVIGTITSPSPPFSKVADTCSGQTIAHAGTCTVTYQFSPASEGTFSSNSNIPSNDPNKNPKTVGLTGTGVAEQGGLSVTPMENLDSSGFEGGPFDRASKDYTLTNTGTTSIQWGANKTQAWVKFSKTSGTLAADASITVNVSTLLTKVKTLDGGTFNDTVTFTNKTDGIGNTTRNVTLTVNTINIKLLSPVIGEKFTVCTYYPAFGPPTFQWDVNGGTLKSFELQFYNEDDPPKKVTVKATATELTQKSLQVKASTWKNILNLPGTGGGKVNWKAVATKQNNKKVDSDIRSFEVAAPEAVGNPKIDPISKATLPTLSWNDNCNSKFKVCFYNDKDYYNGTTNTGLKKTLLSFTDTDPTDNSGIYTKELTSSQWTAIQNVVGKTSGSTIYWHVESSDVVSTKRSAKTDRQEFILKD